MTVFSQSHWGYLVRLNESLIRVKILHKETGRNFIYQESKWSQMTCIRPPSNAWATATSERLVASILPGLSVEVTEKPPIEFFESFISFDNGKNTDFFLRCSGFSVSLTAKPPILFMENFGSVVFWFRSPQNHQYYLVENLGLVFSLELSRRSFCDFKRYKNIFLFQCNMVCCNNRHRITAIC